MTAPKGGNVWIRLQFYGQTTGTQFSEAVALASYLDLSNDVYWQLVTIPLQAFGQEARPAVRLWFVDFRQVGDYYLDDITLLGGCGIVVMEPSYGVESRAPEVGKCDSTGEPLLFYMVQERAYGEAYQAMLYGNS